MIDYKNKFVFIHIPKNAGASINRVIKTSNAETAKMFGNTHTPADFYKANFDGWEDYFKFSFVRNPWDRLYSLYKFNTKRQGKTHKELPFDVWINQDHFTVASDLQTPKVSIKKKPQCDWICDGDGNIMVNFVGRFENLQNDFDKLQRQCNFKTELPKINDTAGMPYKDAYNDKTYAFVEKYFAKDIEMFDYKF